MAGSHKSKGPGTVLFLLFLLLAVAGGSAWVIHTILDNDEPFVAGVTNPEGAIGKAISAVKSKVLGGNSQGADTQPPASADGGAPQPSPGEPGSENALGAVVLGPDGEPLRDDARSALDQRTRMQPPPEAPDGHAGITAGQPPFGSAVSEQDERGAGEDIPLADNMLLVPGAMETPSPALREDPVVRPAFIDNFAAFLAANYWPKGTHPGAAESGITTVSLRWANLRYGAELRGLEGRRGDAGRARSAILGYVLNPAVVGRLYDLYANAFVAALHREADARVLETGADRRFLTPDEKREMVLIYAAYAGRLAAALERYAADPAMRGRVEAYSAAEHAVQEANRVFMESTLAHENELESGEGSRITASRLRMDKDAAAYQRSIREREAMRAELVKAMSGGGASGSGDTLVYTAFWAYRRGADSTAGLHACAKALANMSAKLQAEAKKM